MSANTSSKIKKTNNYSWNRIYAGVISEKSQSDLEDLINVFYMLSYFMETEKECRRETNIPAAQLKSLFEILTSHLLSINNSLFTPGGIFSQCEILAGLKLVRGAGKNRVQEIITSFTDE
ncbi:hypothetical protein ACIU3Q_003707 [Salmonella enterica subsp. enterica serovar Kokomlemle]